MLQLKYLQQRANLDISFKNFALPLSLISPREPGDDRNPAPKFPPLFFFRHFARFVLPKRASKMISKKHRKKCENRGFWLPEAAPKTFQNASEIDVPTNMRFFSNFCSKKLLLQERRHRFRMGFSNTFCLLVTFRLIAFGVHFRSEKPAENLAKTTSDPFKNRCQKRVVF